jgi:hypothetical protein
MTLPFAEDCLRGCACVRTDGTDGANNWRQEGKKDNGSPISLLLLLDGNAARLAFYGKDVRFMGKSINQTSTQK